MALSIAPLYFSSTLLGLVVQVQVLVKGIVTMMLELQMLVVVLLMVLELAVGMARWYQMNARA